MPDNREADKGEMQKPTGNRMSICVLIAFIALVVGGIHYKYVATLFENDRNFSQLSDLEREMSFRTEMGFYYSYYKTVVESRPFPVGISKLMYDRLVEYPKDVNAFNRFNINPEVIIGALYRYFEPWLNSTHRECHMIARGDGQTPVESCVGLGLPIYFYLEAVWWLAGLTVAVLFLHASVLSQSILGGLLAVIQYFSNHTECTRVQWAPNERENMAAPLLLIQTWLLTLQLREKDRGRILRLQVSIFIVNCLCLLFWQFTQFIFFTQTVIFFVMEQLRIIDTKTLSIFLHSHFCGLHTAVLLLQGNEMLKSSLYASFFVVISIYCLFFSNFRIKVKTAFDFFVESWLVLLRVVLALTSALYLKKFISDFLEVEDDNHVWDILYAKFTEYKTFHTLIYTCSEVFDFLPYTSVRKLTKSFLIPLALLSGVNVVRFWVMEGISKCFREVDEFCKEELIEDDDDEDSGIENVEGVNRGVPRELDIILAKLHSKMQKREEMKCYPLFLLRNMNMEPAIFYNFSQLVVFGVMAGLVMRLKMLFSTQLCLVCSLVANRNYNIFPKCVRHYTPLFWAIILLPMLRILSNNIKEEISHVGEFNDYPQEQLLQWISKEGGDGAFAGSMPILSSVMLSTRRPIVAHPHYEHAEARQRAYSVYKMYGRFYSHDLYSELNKLRASYLIVETKYCYGKSKRGCTFENIWDVEYPNLKWNPKLCHTLLTEPVEHFYPVFRNDHYAVFRIHDFSVSYTPRIFDT